jgi:hypothetical protein
MTGVLRTRVVVVVEVEGLFDDLWFRDSPKKRTLEFQTQLSAYELPYPSFLRPHKTKPHPRHFVRKLKPQPFFSTSRNRHGRHRTQQQRSRPNATM